MPRRSQANAELTRATILERAQMLGSVEGLEALSIGRLAADTGLSKSGVIGHFGSKDQLQIATVQAGIERFTQEVWTPIADVDPGILRLRAMMDSWLSYLEREVYPGGCFMTSVAVEFDGRPGAVKSLVASGWKRWLDLIEDEVTRAQDAGDLSMHLPPNQIAFQLYSFVTQGNLSKQLFGGDDVLEPSRKAIAALIG